MRPAESSSLSCGLAFHFLLLSTLSLDSAVTFSYKPESTGLAGTCTPLFSRAFRRTYETPLALDWLVQSN